MVKVYVLWSAIDAYEKPVPERMAFFKKEEAEKRLKRLKELYEGYLVGIWEFDAVNEL